MKEAAHIFQTVLERSNLVIKMKTFWQMYHWLVGLKGLSRDPGRACCPAGSRVHVNFLKSIQESVFTVTLERARPSVSVPVLILTRQVTS